MRVRSFLPLVAMLAGLIAVPAAPAEALTMRSVAAGWVNTYASASPAPAVKTKTPAVAAGHLDAASTIKINFIDVPATFQPAIQAAADIWAINYPSVATINIDAKWVRLGASGILASATPVKFFNRFVGAPDRDIWYPSALANAIAGKDLDPANPEIAIRVNSTVAPTFYLGTDGNCPPGQYDLESIILHEMGHGLGFLSNSGYDTYYKYGNIDQPTPFDAYAQLPDGRRLMDIPSPSLELGTALTHTLVWSGLNGVKANNGIKPLLYTPAIYEVGSSVSHLDEATFSNAGLNAVMTPNLAAGEVFHDPGPLLTAMLQDMREKPPAGVPSGVPTAPRNVHALVGDKSVIVLFDPPTNARTAQVSSYTVKVNGTTRIIDTTTSPVVISGLNNDQVYSFSVIAKNDLGGSDPSSTNAVVPQASLPSVVIDPVADAKYLATGTLNKQLFIVYSDTSHHDIRMVTLVGTKWIKTIIDGNSTVNGKTTNDVSGNLSVCTGKVGTKETLHIFYGDLTDKDLRHASFDGKKWNYEIVDGNGAKIQAVEDPARTSTASDVSTSSACVFTPAGLQVFYRDESQGVLLGAVKDGSGWRYEIVDGDRLTDGRTTGDVAFHMSALSIGTKIFLVYDSVLAVDQNKVPTRGEVRLAMRSSAYPEDWKYSVLDTSNSGIAVAGYSLGISQSGTNVYASWVASSGTSYPATDQLRWKNLANLAGPTGTTTELYGQPNGPIAVDSARIVFSCKLRLCVFNKNDRTIRLVSGKTLNGSAESSLITFGGSRYEVVGVSGRLTLFKLI
ncbi:MAG: fibronectin [Actinomycetes bacterium]